VDEQVLRKYGKTKCEALVLFAENLRIVRNFTAAERFETIRVGSEPEIGTNGA
jgi:hypothetical protein